MYEPRAFPGKVCLLRLHSKLSPFLENFAQTLSNFPAINVFESQKGLRIHG
jgi:hypothetical protein